MHLDNGNIEVDIHNQVHKDWNEIKTSIHIRDCIESMKITIPIPKNYIVDSDDTAIRTFEYLDSAKVKATITVSHTDTGIEYYVTADNDYIKSLLSNNTYKDGLTIELHSYTTVSDIDEWLKNAVITVNPTPYTYLTGKVSSSKWISTYSTYTDTLKTF